MQVNDIVSYTRSLDRDFHDEMNRLFRDVFGSRSDWPGISRNAWSPPTDVYETETGFVVQMEIAGVREGDFRTTLENNVLIVRGVRGDEGKVGRKRFRLMEINRGYFERSIVFKERIDAAGVTASYKDGFLSIVLPKLQEVHQSISIAGD
jgi:HSP20 family protein